MDMNGFRGAMTIIWLVVFLGVVWWAYSPRRKARFDEAARLAVDDQPIGKQQVDKEPANDKTTIKTTVTGERQS